MAQKCLNCGRKLPVGYVLNLCQKCLNQDSKDGDIEPEKSKSHVSIEPNRESGPNTVRVSTRISESLFRSMETLRERNNLTKSEFLRNLIKEGVRDA